MMIEDQRVCRICDGGPGNYCACNCGMKLWEEPKPDDDAPPPDPFEGLGIAPKE